MEQKSSTCLDALAKLSQQREHQSTPANLCFAEQFCLNEGNYSDASFLSSTEEAFISSPSSQARKPELKRVSTEPDNSIFGGCQRDKSTVPELARQGQELEETCSGASSEEEFAQGTPYPHQVGGHGALSSYKRGRVLKPAAKKEIDFYTFVYGDSLPAELEWLRSATPKFYGQREFRETKRRVVGSQTTSLILSKCTGTTTSRVDRKSMERNVWKDQAGELVMDTNPWARACLLRELEKKEGIKSFLILEDLTCHLRKPCVLDCKMGTRHYDDDATEEKKMAHIEKAKKTTSSSTGIRFTGMQVYKKPSNTFLFHDKYYGRRLKPDELKHELFEFLHNGLRLRVDVMEQYLSKLRWLYQHMEKQNYFNFYSSSLLFVYEGDDMAPSPMADVRMIDFAHTQRCKGEKDDGYLFGLSNLIGLISSLLEDERNEVV
jgi:inositol-hexakisphosphate kinase